MIFIIAADHGPWEQWLQKNICDYFHHYIPGNTIFFWEWIEGDSPFPVCQGMGWEEARYKIIASLYYLLMIERDGRLLPFLSKLRGNNNIDDAYDNMQSMLSHPWLYRKGYLKDQNTDPLTAIYNSDLIRASDKMALDSLLNDIRSDRSEYNNQSTALDIMDKLSHIRDMAIVDKINRNRKNKNVVVVVGSAHIDNIKRVLPDSHILELPKDRNYDHHISIWLDSLQI